MRQDDPATLPAIDDPPKSGVFVDHEEFFLAPTPEEIAEGNRLGEAIDVNDDLDNGLTS